MPRALYMQLTYLFMYLCVYLHAQRTYKYHNKFKRKVSLGRHMRTVRNREIHNGLVLPGRHGNGAFFVTGTSSIVQHCYACKGSRCGLECGKAAAK